MGSTIPFTITNEENFKISEVLEVCLTLTLPIISRFHILVKLNNTRKIAIYIPGSIAYRMLKSRSFSSFNRLDNSRATLPNHV